MYAWEQRYATVCTHAWETWTKNGLGLDDEDREQTAKTVRDAVTNVWRDGRSDLSWYRATLARLGAG